MAAAAADKTKAPRGRWTTDFMRRIVAAVGARSGQPLARRCCWVLMCALPLAGCGGLGEWQRQAALRPTPTQAGQAEAAASSWRPGDVRLTLPATDAPRQQVAIWWLPQPDPQAPALLYLHGTFRNLYHNLPKIEALRSAGFAVLAVDYRGWGDSSVMVPSEASINADAALAWAELQRHQGDPARRFIYGHSMGGAVAVTLASGLKYGSDYAALVLESTFTSLPELAAAAGFWGRIAGAATTLEFDSLSRIGRVDAPLLMLHGDADKTVPVALGRRLRDAAPAGVRWVEIAGGTHSRLDSEAPEIYQQALRQIMNTTKTRIPAPSRASSP